MQQGQTAMSIAQKLGYISVVETLKGVTEVTTITPLASDEKYKVVSPETMQETFMSDSEDEGGKAARLQSGQFMENPFFKLNLVLLTIIFFLNCTHLSTNQSPLSCC